MRRSARSASRTLRTGRTLRRSFRCSTVRRARSPPRCRLKSRESLAPPDCSPVLAALLPPPPQTAASTVSSAATAASSTASSAARSARRPPRRVERLPDVGDHPDRHRRAARDLVVHDPHHEAEPAKTGSSIRRRRSNTRCRPRPLRPRSAADNSARYGAGASRARVALAPRAAAKRRRVPARPLCAIGLAAVAAGCSSRPYGTLVVGATAPTPARSTSLSRRRARP